MGFDPAQERLQAHAYLDRLPPGQLSAVRSLLESMLDPVSRAIAGVPVEDERIGDDEARAVAASREWLTRNRPISNEEVLAEFGLTTDDFESMAQTPEPSGMDQ